VINTNLLQYAKYSTPLPLQFGDPTSTSPVASVASGDPSAVTPHAHVEAGVIGREEKIEYRDEQGNLLDDAAVKSLMAEGKAKFETKYETRTRLVDEEGNEIQQPLAPEHPDVEGQNPDTKGVPEGKANKKPAEAQAASSAGKARQNEAKPASDANEATK
jgi:dolichyl-phosphate-mannose-protein mannosyltransferase